jgi:hypothetical protein
LKHEGHWAIKVLEAGNYLIRVRRWPEESGKKINEALPAGEQVPGADKAFRAQVGHGIEAKSATMRLNGKNWQTKPISKDSEEISFSVLLSKGVHKLSPYFSIPEGELGCYYAIVESR